MWYFGFFKYSYGMKTSSKSKFRPARLTRLEAGVKEGKLEASI